MSTATLRDPVRDWARSGVAWLTGHPDGPPVIPPGVAATRASELTDLIANARQVFPGLAFRCGDCPLLRRQLLVFPLHFGQTGDKLCSP